jgi:ABC-type thiamine transport system ATPase subunit
VTALLLEHVSLGALFRAHERIGPGLTVVTGDSSTALATLVDVMAGVERPRFGRVTLDDVDPFGTPAERRRIAALLASERLPPAPTVRASVERVLRARGDGQSAQAVLETAGLGAAALRRTADLNAGEERAIALALALLHPAPRLVALYEPFRAGNGLSPDSIRETLRRHAGHGAVVVVAVQGADPLRSLSAHRLELQGGTLGPARPPLGFFRGSVSLRARTPEPQRLLKVLAEDPAVTGVHWDERMAPGLVVAFGTDLEAVAGALSRAAESTGALVEAITPGTVPVTQPAPGAYSAAATATYSTAAPQGVTYQLAYPPAYAPATYPGPSAPADASTRSPDQSVSMPTGWADPTRKGEGGAS